MEKERHDKVFRKDIIPLFAKRAGLTQKKAEETLDAFQDLIYEFLCKETDVYLTGFGTFWVRERREREGRNPMTKEEYVIPATYKPEFKASRVLWGSVDQKIKGEKNGE